jgi:hypothetical protein
MNMPNSGVNMRRSLSCVSAGHGRGGVLQGQIDASAEGLRHRDDGPHEQHREPGRAQQPLAAEEQHHAGGVDHRLQRQGRQLQQPVLVDGDDEQHLVADKHQRGRAGEHGEAPPAAFGTPADGAPRPQDEQVADEGDDEAHGLEVVGKPNADERVGCVVDRQQAEGGAEGGDGSRLDCLRMFREEGAHWLEMSSTAVSVEEAQAPPGGRLRR